MKFTPGKLYQLKKDVLMIEKDYREKPRYFEKTLRKNSALMFLEEIPRFWNGDGEVYDAEKDHNAKVFLYGERFIVSNWPEPDFCPEDFYEEVQL